LEPRAAAERESGQDGQVSRGKKPVRGHGKGAATHNGATKPGKLEVTIWGITDKEPDRKMAIVLDEASTLRLAAHLRQYGFDV
jgi:hypothetical protein